MPIPAKHTTHSLPGSPHDARPIPWERIEALLHHVQRPGRYVGGEYNSVIKRWEKVTLRICLAFPDLYELGMSNFALMILYDILNQRPDVWAQRTYLPAPDMIKAMRAAGIPLYSLESRHPVAHFDVLAISTAYEQLYTNILELLNLAGLPLHSTDRDERHPLVIGGGHGAFNPEPIVDFFDLFVIGEAEEVIVEMAEVLIDTAHAPREEQLRALLKVPGLYIPRFYRPHYAADGTLKAVEPTEPHAPSVVTKRLVATLPPSPIRQLVPNLDTVHNRAVIEIQRGCTRGCRFCQAGTITRPVRERPVAEIVEAAEAIIDATGYEEIALLSLSSADYSHIDELVRQLLTRLKGRNVSISLPSLRIDSFSIELADMLTHERRSGITLAPEAGSEALRRRINKDIETATLLSVAEEIFKRGWRTLKLYFMIGLPTETDADVRAIVDLAQEVRRLGYRIGGRKTEVHVSVSTFVPKPHTVFQWEPLADAATIERRQAILKAGIHGRGLRLAWNHYEETRLEALLARGDRRLNAVVELAWRRGARFDAWDEWRNESAWRDALTARPGDLSIAFPDRNALETFYLYRRRHSTEVLPWDHLRSGIERTFFLQDYERSQRGEPLSDCRKQCHACGILRRFSALRSEAWQCPISQH